MDQLACGHLKTCKMPNATLRAHIIYIHFSCFLELVFIHFNKCSILQSWNISFSHSWLVIWITSFLENIRPSRYMICMKYYFLGLSFSESHTHHGKAMQCGSCTTWLFMQQMQASRCKVATTRSTMPCYGVTLKPHLVGKKCSKCTLALVWVWGRFVKMAQKALLLRSSVNIWKALLLESFLPSDFCSSAAATASRETG